MNPISLPYRILALSLLLLAGMGFGYVQGVTRESDRRDAQVLKQVRSAQKAADKESTRREALGAARETSREQIRVVYQTLKEQADENIKYFPHPNPLPEGEGTNANSNFNILDCGLDADGLRIWNAANSGASAPLPGEPDYGLSCAAASGVGKSRGLVPQPHPGDGAGAPMPRPVEQAGGVRTGIIYE